MIKKTYIVEIDHHFVRTIISEKSLLIGTYIPDEYWLGKKIVGGNITQIFCKF